MRSGLGGRGPEFQQNVGSNLSRFHRWAKRLVGATPARKRTEITIETDRVVTIRRRRAHEVWCRECGRLVDAVGLDEAGVVGGVAQAGVRDQAWAQAWHVCEGWDGELLICVQSLLK